MMEPSVYPALCVLIPAYNAESTIGEAILSAFAAGAGSVVVVNDGSRDGTASEARRAGAVVIDQENMGAAASRARLLSEAHTDYVIFLDADDRLEVSGVSAAIEKLGADSAAVCVVSGYIPEVSPSELGDPVLPWRETINTRSLLRRGHAPAPPASIAWRTNRLRDVMECKSTVGLPPSISPPYAEDYEILIRGSLLGPVLSVNDAGSIYRAFGGKSARDPLSSLRAAEEIRRTYARHAMIRLPRRSDRVLRSMALRRSAMRTSTLRSIALVAASIALAPDLYLELAFRRVQFGWRGRARRAAS